MSHGAGIGVTPPPHTAYRSLISRAINCALSLDNSNSESLASVFLCKLAARAFSFLLCNTLSTISSLSLSLSLTTSGKLFPFRAHQTPLGAVIWRREAAQRQCQTSRLAPGRHMSSIGQRGASNSLCSRVSSRFGHEP